jgi:hypothetical protein
MKRLAPFFLLIQRPLVLFGAVGWMIMATFLLGAVIGPNAQLTAFLDGAYLAMVLLSTYTGWVVGSCILELQQTSFAHALPGVRRGLVPGFLLFGAACVALAVGLIEGGSREPVDAALLFVVGMACYTFGGAIRDPESEFMTGLGVALLLVLLFASGTLGRLAAEQPMLMVAGAATLAVVSLYRMFARAAFRSRPINLRGLVLAFSMRKLTRADRSRSLSYGPRKSRWSRRYLGHSETAWLRAAWYETYGSMTLRSIGVFLVRSWGLLLILVFAALETRGELGFWKSLTWVLHDALMRSPHEPVYGGDGGPFIIVALVLLIIGAGMAMFRPVAFRQWLAYPVSRDLRVRLDFLGGLADLAVLLCVIGPVLALAGYVSGWAVGFTPRFDYMPYFVRVLMVTVVLMPFAYWMRQRLQLALAPGDAQPIVGIVLAQVVFVLAGLLLVYVVERLGSDATQWVVLLLGLLISRAVYLAGLRSHYRTADLI